MIQKEKNKHWKSENFYRPSYFPTNSFVNKRHYLIKEKCSGFKNPDNLCALNTSGQKKSLLTPRLTFIEENKSFALIYKDNVATSKRHRLEISDTFCITGWKRSRCVFLVYSRQDTLETDPIIVDYSSACF